MDVNQNPEALHDVASTTKKLVQDKFVNSGIPEEPLVTRDQMAQATVKGDGSKKLSDNIIK